MALYFGVPKPTYTREERTTSVCKLVVDVQNKQTSAPEESSKEHEQTLKVLNREGVAVDEALNLQQVLEVLKISKSTFYALIRNGLVCRGRKFKGRKFRYWRKSVIKEFAATYHCFGD